MKPLNTRFLTVLTTVAFLGCTVCAFAAQPDKCGDGMCKGKETPTSCPEDCSGGGGGDDGGLGSAIPMNCLLGESWGDVPDSGDMIDTIRDDKLGWYEDEVDRATCSIEGPSVPWPIYLKVWRDKGKPPNLIRKVDMVLGEVGDDGQRHFNIGTFDDVVAGFAEGSSHLRALYPGFFAVASEEGTSGFPNMDEMDALRFNVRPYRNDPDQTTESIHRLAWKPEGYEMGMHFGKPDTGIARFAISIASQHYEGNESFTGISCESGLEAEILTHSPELGDSVAGRAKGAMRDVSVYLWSDIDGDGLADGYTVTTGEIGVVELGHEGPPNVTSGARWAAVCSAVGGDEPCGNPRAPSNCNFLGYVEVQFTLHACASALCEGD